MVHDARDTQLDALLLCPIHGLVVLYDGLEEARIILDVVVSATIGEELLEIAAPVADRGFGRRLRGGTEERG